MGTGRMGRAEALGLVVAMAGALGAQSTEEPPEALQITTVEALITMSRTEFESWCHDKGARSEASVGSSEETKATCAWIDSETGQVWHAALHFEVRSAIPSQADAGLLHASTPILLRHVYNEHGTTDGESSEGFPVWRVDVDGREGLLAVAEYDEITLVQIRMPQEGISLSMR